MDAMPRPRVAEAQTLEAALTALNRTTGITGKVVGQEQWDAEHRARADAQVTLTAGGKRHNYVVEVKNTDRFAALGVIKTQLAAYKDAGLLVAPYVTAELAERCRQLELQFVDTAGNAYLDRPGLFVLVTGQRRNPQETVTPARRANTATGMRVVFALLCKPDLLNAPYRVINEAAGVALGAVGWVFFDLNGRGHVLGDGRKGERRFTDPRRLVNEWVVNYPLKLRPKLALGNFRAPHPEWWRKTKIEAYDACWGGEIAGDMLVHNREPGLVTVYMRGDAKRLILDQRLRADAKGDIEILEKFWHFEYAAPTKAPHTVPPLLVYADLMAGPDPRNHETAKLVYDRHLAHAFGPT